jgi:hypothetical protein
MPRDVNLSRGVRVQLMFVARSQAKKVAPDKKGV